MLLKKLIQLAIDDVQKRGEIYSTAY